MNYFRCGGGRSTHTATKIDVAKTPLATFQSNVSGLYIPEILAYIQATQSGTGDPSPINPRAINGVSEVTTACNAINQWDEEWEVGGYDTTTGQKNTATNRIRSSNYIVVSPSTIYYFVNANVAYRVFFYTANKTYISNTAYNANSHEVLIPDNCRFITFQMGGDYGTTYNNDVSINYPATDTAYHAYTGTTATTALGGTYYGGFLNVPTGLLTVTHRYYEFDGSNDENWMLQRINSYGIANFVILVDNFSNIYGLCNRFTRQSSLIATTTTEGYIMAPSNSLYIRIDSTRASNVATFRQWLTNNIVQFVYELTTPQTVQLAPEQIAQLLGQNNVFCSSGDVAVKYWKID